ncbi:MAG TPA: DNA alkylation response protein, partial [Ktedonobacteraceae bacterium]
MSLDMKTTHGHATHDVFNQVPPLVNYNVFEQDPTLVESVQREGAGWVMEQAAALGAVAGSEEAIQWSFEANAVTPVLHTFDKIGQRIDEVTFHPAWHNLMRTTINAGAHALSWREERTGRHVARTVIFYVSSQMEGGHCCPVSMTHAVVSVLRGQPHLAAAWEPLLTSLVYDPGLRPPQEKQGILCGMGMTEKQGGSDVRANTTRAEPCSSEGE